MERIGRIVAVDEPRAGARSSAKRSPGNQTGGSQRQISLEPTVYEGRGCQNVARRAHKERFMPKGRPRESPSSSCAGYSLEREKRETAVKNVKGKRWEKLQGGELAREDASGESKTERIIEESLAPAKGRREERERTNMGNATLKRIRRSGSRDF